MRSETEIRLKMSELKARLDVTRKQYQIVALVARLDMLRWVLREDTDSVLQEPVAETTDVG